MTGGCLKTKTTTPKTPPPQYFMTSSKYIHSYSIVLIERNQVTEKDIVDLDSEKLISETVHLARAFHCFHGCFNTLVTEVELFAGRESQNYKSQLEILCRLNVPIVSLIA